MATVLLVETIDRRELRQRCKKTRYFITCSQNSEGGEKRGKYAREGITYVFFFNTVKVGTSEHCEVKSNVCVESFDVFVVVWA